MSSLLRENTNLKTNLLLTHLLFELKTTVEKSPVKIQFLFF